MGTPRTLSAPAGVVVGRIVGLYGVQGWVRVASFTRPPQNLLDYRHWELILGDVAEPVVADELRSHGRGFIARLGGCNSRDAAIRYVGADIRVARGQLPAAADGEYYWADLIGLAVTTPDGSALGVVTRVMETGANDVLVVTSDAGEHLIPFVAGIYIRSVDLAGRRIVADWQADY
ncbi:MAG: ribosome maturation factor RimM [Gammaproteobacteria bacterium]|nr:ribosome maturation factor RimM [Gammaproteobacteria bacterium]